MYISTTRFDVCYMTGIGVTAAVLGGIGNIPGACWADSCSASLNTGHRLYRRITRGLCLCYLMLVLIVRPTGLLGERLAEKA